MPAKLTYQVLATDTNFSLRITLLYLLNIQPWNHRTKLIFFWGPTRTRKSERCNKNATSLSSVYYKNQGLWWDNYHVNSLLVRMIFFPADLALGHVLLLWALRPNVDYY